MKTKILSILILLLIALPVQAQEQ
ncbi:hypothetical protein LCGC14_2722430, partial [marine sediment metagenome]